MSRGEPRGSGNEGMVWVDLWPYVDVFYEISRAIESRAPFLLLSMLVHQSCDWSALPFDSLNDPGAGTGDRVLSHEHASLWVRSGRTRTDIFVGGRLRGAYR